MAAVNEVNPNAEVMRKKQALLVNVGAATGMQEVLKTNLGKFIHRTSVEAVFVCVIYW